MKIANSQEFISKYVTLNNGYATFNSNVNKFYESDDEAILVGFNRFYRNIMIEIFKQEKNEIYKNTIEKNENIINNDKSLDDFNKKVYELYNLYATDEFIDFCNEICTPEMFNKELLKNGEVRKNLKNNFWIFHEFNSTLIDVDNKFVEGEDFSFLILNAIKSLEYLLYRKIRNYGELKKIKLNDKINDKTMLDNLIYYIEKHKEMFRNIDENIISKEKYDIYTKSYIQLLYYVKDSCRNGYFHKHRLDTYNELCEKRNKVLEAIAKTIIFLN